VIGHRSEGLPTLSTFDLFISLPASASAASAVWKGFFFTKKRTQTLDRLESRLISRARAHILFLSRFLALSLSLSFLLSLFLALSLSRSLSLSVHFSFWARAHTHILIFTPTPTHTFTLTLTLTRTLTHKGFWRVPLAVAALESGTAEDEGADGGGSSAASAAPHLTHATIQVFAFGCVDDFVDSIHTCNHKLSWV